jgi:hypothetical protein
MAWQEPPFYQVVEKKYNSETNQRDLRFPDTSTCEECGGSRYVYPSCFDGGEQGYKPGTKKDDPMLALQIDLVKFGYTDAFKRPECVEPRSCCTLHRGDDKGVPAREVMKPDQEYGVFPTIGVCSGCGGFNRVFMEKTIRDPWLTLRVSLIQFGKSTCRHFDSGPPDHVCDCEARLAVLEKTANALPLLEDSGWSLDERTSIPIRGIRDYSRKMVFGRSLSSEEMDDLREWLQRKECPGWTGISVRSEGQGSYMFRTTWDSSD